MTEFMTCKVCQKKMTEQRLSSSCSKCDTTDAGTWFLSYLSDLGYVKLHDEVWHGSMSGTTKNNFLALPDGSLVYVRIDDRDKTLFHVSYLLLDGNKINIDYNDNKINTEDEDEDEDEDDEAQDWGIDDDDDDDDAWWEKSSTKKMDFRFDMVNGLKLVK